MDVVALNVEALAVILACADLIVVNIAGNSSKYADLGYVAARVTLRYKINEPAELVNRIGRPTRSTLAAILSVTPLYILDAKGHQRHSPSS